jgi:hypothetical protein
LASGAMDLKRLKTTGLIHCEKAYRNDPLSRPYLGKPRRRWTDIKLDLGQIGWDGVDWIDLVQDKGQWRSLVKTVMNLRVL